MIERVSYIADDGTAFEDEDECIDYERTLMLKKYEHDIHMWDNEFQPIPITDPKALDKIYYLTCDTAEAVEVMNDWFEYMCYSSLSRPEGSRSQGSHGKGYDGYSNRL